MSDTNLRSSIIRLASTNPELRPQLLPLLKEAGSYDYDIEELVLGQSFSTLQNRLNDLKKEAMRLADQRMNGPADGIEAQMVEELGVELGKLFRWVERTLTTQVEAYTKKLRRTGY